MKKPIFILFMICLTSSLCFAADEYDSFLSFQEQQRFHALTRELRCLVCQNQTLDQSNAALAADLRAKIYHQIQEGKSDKQIMAYLTSRYGDYILYRPPFNRYTLLLWCGPFLLLILAISYLFFYLSKARQTK